MGTGLSVEFFTKFSLSQGTMADQMQQTERAFQKQPTVFLNSKRALGSKKKELRHTKTVGLGFKTPREAIVGNYIDKKCPFTGNVSIRGRISTGVITKMKMQRTCVVRRDYLHFFVCCVCELCVCVCCVCVCVVCVLCVLCMLCVLCVVC